MVWCTRAVVLPLISIGAVFNLYVLFSILHLWFGLRRDAESEWEGGGHNLIGTFAAIVVTYTLLSSTAYAIGIFGVYKRIPSYVRIFLQFSFADFALYVLALVGVAFACYRPSNWRDSTCEGLSTQPDILRTLAQAGLDLENCENWIENVVLWVLISLSVGLMFKLQFIVAVTTYYSSLARATGHHVSVLSTVRAPTHRASVSTSTGRRQGHGLPSPRDSKRASQILSDLPPYSDRESSPTRLYSPVRSVNGDADGKDALISMYEMDEHTSVDAKRRE